MNYSPEVISFVERHIDLIDKANWKALLALTMTNDEDPDFLNNDQCIELYMLLGEVGIKIDRSIIDYVLLESIKAGLEIYFLNELKGNSLFFINHYLPNSLGIDRANTYHFILDHLDELGISIDNHGMIM